MEKSYREREGVSMEMQWFRSDGSRAWKEVREKAVQTRARCYSVTVFTVEVVSYLWSGVSDCLLWM